MCVVVVYIIYFLLPILKNHHRNIKFCFLKVWKKQTKRKNKGINNWVVGWVRWVKEEQKKNKLGYNVIILVDFVLVMNLSVLSITLWVYKHTHNLVGNYYCVMFVYEIKG